MNGYLRSKCRSEQQLLNELAKLLGARDVASRKMGDVLRELTFFYASAPAAQATHLPHTLLSGLCALLPQLKDKKESVLLKEDHLRITRLALCLVARLIDQFELHVQNASSLSDGSEAGVEKPSVELATSALAGFLTALETAVLTPSGLLLPRQRAILRVYAQLCRVFHKRDQLVSHAAGLLQQSPVLADPPTVDVKGKRSSTAPGPAQVAAVAAACHALRFHVESDEQIVALDKLVQAAFVIPAGTASRHASSTLLALFTSSPPADEDRPPHAVAVAKALERFLLKARPSSLRSGDSLTSVYLLRLCGLLHRLPVHQQQPVPLANEGAGSDLDSKLLTANDPLEAQVQSAAIQGVVVSNALAAMLQEYLMDVIQATVANGASSKPVVAPAVLLTAVEEALRGSDTQTSFLKLPNWGNMCLFELVAAALLSLLPSQRDAAKAAGHAVVLHRVCRAVQFVAERLDTAVLQLNASSGQSTPSPAYLSHLALRVRSLTKHSNAFVACEALRAFVWLLPRGDAGSQDAEDDWPALMTQLETLPLDYIQPERRAAIAWTLFRRGVTTPKTHRYAVDTTLLAGCLRVVLAWFRARPCVWHAALLTAVWHTALRDCLAPLGDAVFASINEVLDYQCAPSDPAAANSLVVKQSALQFLSQREGGVRYAVQRQVWSRPLLLRLTKQALLETCTSQRLSVRALSQLHQEAERQGSSPLTEQLAATLRFLQRTPGQPGQTDSASSGAFESRALTTPASDLSNWGESKSVEMPQQVVAADEDPFSDFRAPADATVSLVTEETAAKKYGDIATAEDPFVDFREAERTASAGFTGWGDFDTANKQTEVAETKDEAFSVFDAPGDNTPSSAFAAWDDDDSTHKPDEAAGDPFTDFRATDSTAAAGFTDWPDEGLAEKQQTAADTADRPSPDLGAAGAASAFPSWGGDVAVETQEEPGDSGEAFMEVTASCDSEAPKRADVDDIAANFDEKDAAFSAFSAPSADSAFAGWGDSVAVEEQDEPSEAVSFVDCAVVDDSTASTFANSPDGDTKEMQQLPSPATGEAFADFRASEETAASGFTNWGCSATVEETQEEGPAVLDNRDRPESAFASWAAGDTTEIQPAVSDGHDHSELVFDAGTIESPLEAALSNWTNGDAAAKSEAADQGQGLTASEQHAAFDVHDEIHAEFHDTMAPNPSSWTESDATKATFGTQGSTPDVGVAVSESVIPLDSDAAEKLDTDLEPVCADTEASTTAAASPFASWGEEDASEAFSGTVACGAEVSFTFPSNDLVTEQHAAATTSTLDERFEACGVGMEVTSVLDGEMSQKHDGLDGLSAPQIDPSAGFEDCDVVLDAATPSSSNDAVAFEETTVGNAFASFRNTSDGAVLDVQENEITGWDAHDAEAVSAFPSVGGNIAIETADVAFDAHIEPLSVLESNGTRMGDPFSSRTYDDDVEKAPVSFDVSDGFVTDLEVHGETDENDEEGMELQQTAVDAQDGINTSAARGVEVESGAITNDAKPEKQESTVGDSLQDHAVSDVDACVTTSVSDAFDSWTHDTATRNDNAVVLEEEPLFVCSDSSAVIGRDEAFGSEEPDLAGEFTGAANCEEPNQTSLESHNETIADVDVPEAESESATLRMASGDTMAELNAALDVRDDSFSDFEPRNSEMEASFPVSKRDNSVAHSSAQREGFGDFDAFDSGMADVEAMEQLQASVDAQHKACDDAEAQCGTETTFAKGEAPPDVQDTCFADLEPNEVPPQFVSINGANDDAADPVIRFPSEATETNHADFDVPASYCAAHEALQAEPSFNFSTSASDEAFEKEPAAFDEQDEVVVDERELGTGSVLVTKANDDAVEQQKRALDSHDHEREAVLDASLEGSGWGFTNRNIDDATGTEAAYHEVESERLAAFEVPSNDMGSNGVDSVDSDVENQQRTDPGVEMEPFSAFETRSAEEELNFNGEASEDEVEKETVLSGTPDEVLDGGEMPGSSQASAFSSTTDDGRMEAGCFASTVALEPIDINWANTNPSEQENSISASRVEVSADQQAHRAQETPFTTSAGNEETHLIQAVPNAQDETEVQEAAQESTVILNAEAAAIETNHTEVKDQEEFNEIFADPDGHSAFAAANDDDDTVTHDDVLDEQERILEDAEPYHGIETALSFSSANADTIEEEQALPGAPEEPVAGLEACEARAESGFAGVVNTEALNLLDDAVEDQNELLWSDEESGEVREPNVIDSTNDGTDTIELRDHEAETLPEVETSRPELEPPSTYRANDYQREESAAAQDEIYQRQTEAASASTSWTDDDTVTREKAALDVEDDLVAEPETSGVVQGSICTREVNVEAEEANHIDAKGQEEFDEIFLDAGAAETGPAVFTANTDDDTVAQENSARDDQKDLVAGAELRGIEAACTFSGSVTESTTEEEQASLDALNEHAAELGACGDADESTIASGIEEEVVEKEAAAMEEGDAIFDTRPSCTATNERREKENVGLDAEGELELDLNARETEAATTFSSRANDDMSVHAQAAGGVRQDEFDELFADPNEQGGGSVSTTASQVEGGMIEQEATAVDTQKSILAGSEAPRTALESAGDAVTDGMNDDFSTAIAAPASIHSSVADPDAHNTLPTSFDDHDEFDEIFADPEGRGADPTSAASTWTHGDTMGGEQVVFDDEGDVFAGSEDFAAASTTPNHAAFQSEDDFDEIFRDPSVDECNTVPASAIPSSSNDEATEMEDIDLDVSTSDAHGAEAESILIDGNATDKKHGALDTEDATVSETEIRGGSPTCS